jgi:membrane-associated phospholipid phosphatase
MGGRVVMHATKAGTGIGSRSSPHSHRRCSSLVADRLERAKCWVAIGSGGASVLILGSGRLDVGGLDAVDRAVESWAAARRTGQLDAVAHALSSLADRSRLWVGVGALRAALDGRRGRLLAVRAITIVAVESALIHLVVKRLFQRTRPAVDVSLRFGARRPPSSSFPSGHAASAATAALLLADGDREWTVALGVLATAVAWSRVQTGLHHATDAVAGMALGAGVAMLARRFLPVG